MGCVQCRVMRLDVVTFNLGYQKDQDVGRSTDFSVLSRRCKLQVLSAVALSAALIRLLPPLSDIHQVPQFPFFVLASLSLVTISKNGPTSRHVPRSIKSRSLSANVANSQNIGIPDPARFFLLSANPAESTNQAVAFTLY